MTSGKYVTLSNICDVDYDLYDVGYDQTVQTANAVYCDRFKRFKQMLLRLLESMYVVGSCRTGR